MVLISEIPGGSNGGDPNKNPQDEEKNQNENLQQVNENPSKNPQEEEEDREQNENPQQVEENLSSLEQLPRDIMESILACFSRFEYAGLSLVCKAFHQVIRSQNLFQARSCRGFTELVLYALIGFPPFLLPTWFRLRRSNYPFPLQLSRISSLPLMFPGSATLTIEHKMYVMGGYIGLYQPLRTVFVIDCRFHTWETLPYMQRARKKAAAGVIDGKIYVIGGCKKRDNDWVEVFDIEQRSWETVPTQCPIDASESGEFGAYVMIQKKIFILDPLCCLAYEPRQGIWQSWDITSNLRRRWHPTTFCVIEDLLYTIDFRCSYPSIVVYYPNELVWRPVRGLQAFEYPELSYGWSAMANFGGKLVILFCCYGGVSQIWCVEIALETRQGGEIWGRVESFSHVLAVEGFPSIERFQTAVTF